MNAKRLSTGVLVFLAFIIGAVLRIIFTIANFNYLHLEISFSILLIIILIIGLITKKEVLGSVLGTLLWIFFFYTFFFAYYTEGNRLFLFSLFFISIICYLLFSHFFVPEGAEREFRIPVNFLKRRESFGLILALVTLFLFLKIVFDLQILNISFVISKEGLSDFYGVIAQVFGTILAIMVTMTIFILSSPSKLASTRQIFIRGVKGIAVFEVAAIFCHHSFIPNLSNTFDNTANRYIRNKKCLQ